MLRQMMLDEPPVLARVVALLDGKRPSHHLRVRVIEGFGNPAVFAELRVLEVEKAAMIGHPGVNLGERLLFFVGPENVVHPCGVAVPDAKLVRAIRKIRQAPGEGAYPLTLANAPECKRSIRGDYVLINCGAETDGPLIVYDRRSERVVGNCGFQSRIASLCRRIVR